MMDRSLPMVGNTDSPPSFETVMIVLIHNYIFTSSVHSFFPTYTSLQEFRLARSRKTQVSQKSGGCTLSQRYGWLAGVAHSHIQYSETDRT